MKTKDALFETLEEFKEVDKVNPLNFDSLESLLRALEPVELAVKVSSKKDATLLTVMTLLFPSLFIN